MSRHADAVLAATESKNATSLIATSWRRCVLHHGIDPDERRLLEGDPWAAREAAARCSAMIAATRPYLDLLFEVLGDPLGVATLVDSEGTLIAMRTGTTQEAHELQPLRNLGASISEAAMGTNGNGTCLAEGRPLIVSGEDHFLSMLTGRVCIAAPIFGTEGQIVGALNALTRSTHPHREGILRYATVSFAQKIEIELFATAFPDALITLVSPSNPVAMLAVDRDRVVVGATRSARRLLSLGPECLRRTIDIDGLRGDAPPGTVADAERELVARVLARHDGNVTRAARELGITRATLRRKSVDLPRKM